MKPGHRIRLSFHGTAQVLALCLCLLQLAGFILQNPYQIPSQWLRLGLVAGLAFVGWRAAVAGLVGFFLAIPVLGFLHLRLGLEDTLLETLVCGLYLGWLARKAVSRELLEPQAPFAALCAHGLLIVIFCSMLGLLRVFTPEFLVYRILFTQPIDQLDPLFSYRAGLTLSCALCLFEMARREGSGLLTDERFFRVLAVQAALVVVFAAIQLFFQYPVLRLPGLFSPFADIHSFAGYAALLFVFFFSLALASGPARPGGRALAACLAGGLLCSIALSNSRSTWLVALAAIAATLLARTSRRKALSWLATGLLSLVILGGIFQAATRDYGDTLSTSMRHNIVVRIRNLISLPGEFLKHQNGGEVQTVNGRFSLWKRALELARHDPLVGAGIGSFYRNSNAAGDKAGEKAGMAVRQNAHNWYLQLLAELGLAGLLLMLGLAWACVSPDRFGSPPVNPLRRALALGLAAYATSCLVSHHLIVNTQQYMIFFLLAWLCPQPSEKSRGCGKSMILIAAVAVVAGYQLVGVLGAKPPENAAYGLYPRESGDAFGRRWTMREFGFPVRIENSEMLLEFQGAAPSIPGGRQRLTLFLDGRVLDTVILDSAATRRLCYRTGGLIGKTVRLGGELDRAYNPSTRGAGPDNRDLGVLLGDVRFFPDLPGAPPPGR
jgi:O-antigen ligase